MSRKILSCGFYTAAMHAAAGLLAWLVKAPTPDAAIHAVFAVLYAAATPQLPALAASSPRAASLFVWGLFSLDLAQLAWSAVAHRDFRVWIVVHVLAWTPVGAFLLARETGRASAAVLPGPEALPAPDGTTPGFQGRLPPRVRGLLALGLGLALLKGAALVFSRRGGYDQNAGPHSDDPLGLLFLPGILIALHGVVEVVLGKPMSGWSGAWDEMSDAEQRVVVYGLFFGLPFALYAVFNWIL